MNPAAPQPSEQTPTITTPPVQPAPAVPTPVAMAQPVVAAPVVAPQPMAGAVAYAVPDKKGSGFSISGMVLGIVSILTFILFFISIPAAIVGFILSCIGIRRAGKGMAITGIVTTIIGLLLTIAFWVFAIASAQQMCAGDQSKLTTKQRQDCASLNDKQMIDVIFSRS